MQYKTYRAETYDKAVAQMRLEMGLESIILSRKDVKKGGFFGTGLGAKTMVEIKAAKREDFNQIIGEKKDTSIPPAASKERRKLDVVVGGMERSEISVRDELSALQNQINHIVQHKKTAALSSVSEGESGEPGVSPPERFAGLPAPLNLILTKMGENNLPANMIDRMKETVEKNLNLEEQQNMDIVHPVAQRCLADMLPLSGRLEADGTSTRVVVLVGPTGVGKTTTLAKLAAQYYREERKIALFSSDQFRIAAQEQLKVYAEIFEADFESVSTCDDLNRINTEREYDVILVDTNGVSPKDIMRLNELKKFVSGIDGTVDIVLTVAANVSPDNLTDIMLHFEKTGFTNILITKVDEAVSIGRVLATVAKWGKPISYFCHGQEVPNDIDEAVVGYISRLLWDRN